MNFYVKKQGKKPTSDKPIVPVYKLDPTNRKRNPYTKFGQNRTLRSKVIALTDTYILAGYPCFATVYFLCF